MRKALSLVLAVVMVLGMATVAFAANSKEPLTLSETGWSTKPTDDSKEIGSTTQYGKTIFIPIIVTATGNQLELVRGATSEESEAVKDIVDGIRVKVSYDMGKEFVAGTPTVVSKKTDGQDNYQYYLAIETVDAPEETDENDVIMYVTLNSESKDLPVTFSLKNPGVSIDSDFDVTAEEDTVWNFDDVDDVIEINFDEVYALFTVNAKGESEKPLYFDYEVNQAVLDANPTANIDFLRFRDNPRFYKTGTLAITCDADAFVYEITEDNEVVALQGEYNKETEMFEFRTRTLGYYAISDVELVDGAAPVVDGDDVIDEVPSASEAPTTDDGTKGNPDTGVNGFANVAVVTAVVALAAAGAVAFKK